MNLEKIVFNLTHQEAHVLLWVMSGVPGRRLDVAHRFHTTEPVFNRTLEELEERGIIEWGDFGWRIK
jgi:predicted transcriptional regulator